jgi:N-acetylglucosamine kinase-like BadF-type ATPase
MNERRYYLGVDGGGTKTEFVCIAEDGAMLASHREPTTYHLQVGLDGAGQVIRRGIATICGAIGITPNAFTYAFFGLPAFGEDSVIDPQLERLCGEALGHRRYRCGNDMICGWAGSLDCEDGINLVAGTGSIGYGERRGKSARVGGWGEIFSDEGSAYAIAIGGLNAFTRMSDGRLPRTALYGMIRHALSLGDDLELCERVMGQHGMTRDQIANLARLVARAEEEGDDAAREILVRAARELATMAKALRTTLGFEEGENAQISCSGSVLTRMTQVRAAFENALDEAGGFTFVTPRHPPAYGAALYARRLAHA